MAELGKKHQNLTRALRFGAAVLDEMGIRLSDLNPHEVELLDAAVLVHVRYLDALTTGGERDGAVPDHG